MHRGSDAAARRCGERQDQGGHHSRGLSDCREGRRATRHPGGHLHQQGSRRNAREGRAAAEGFGPTGRQRADGFHVPLVLRSPPAKAWRGAGSGATGLYPRIHDLRLGRPEGGDQGVAAGSRGWRGEAQAELVARHDQPRQELRDQTRGTGGPRPGRDGCDQPRLSGLREGFARIECPRFRRLAAGVAAVAGRLPGDSRSRQLALPLRDGRRVPGHEPAAVRNHAPAGGTAPQRLRGRRRGPGNLLLAWSGHRQHPRIRDRLSQHQDPAPGAELPLEQEHPGGCELPGREEQAAQGQAIVD